MRLPGPQAFCRSGSAVLGDYLYIFGSYDGNIAFAFNLITEEWEESTPAMYGNYNWCAVATDEHIYIVGRYLNSAYGNEFQMFTPDGAGPVGTWELMADYPISACGIAADWDGGNYIYASGGGGIGGTSLNAYRYDIADDTWENITFGGTGNDGTGNSDSDDLTDYEESVYGTNPFLGDTDEDGLSDSIEIDNDTDPLDPKSGPKEKGEPFSSSCAFTSSGSAQLPVFMIILAALFLFVRRKNEK